MQKLSLIVLTGIMLAACGSTQVVDKRAEPAKRSLHSDGCIGEGCCLFPLLQAPLRSFDTEGREFGASRSEGRQHAAADLLGHKGDPVRAVMKGTLVDYYEFYLGTFAVVVKNEDGSVFRYGEVASLAEGLKVGDSVQAGQTIALMGQPANSAMLHFEMYSGDQEGPLTQVDLSPYQRRGDLINPTPHLQTWLQSLENR